MNESMIAMLRMLRQDHARSFVRLRKRISTRQLHLNPMQNHTRTLARRKMSVDTRIPLRGPLPPDVDPSTGLCANGRARVAPCISKAKGMGVFAVESLEAGFEIGRYAGEVITLTDLLSRYGAGGFDATNEYEAANKQARWMQDRERRTVGFTGQYVFNAGTCPCTMRAVLIDGEDHEVANWTRYINHSARRPNLQAASEVVASSDGKSMGTPVVRFLVKHAVEAGEELLFDYGDGFDVDLLGFEE